MADEATVEKKKSDVKERLQYLEDQFNVFDETENISVDEKTEEVHPLIDNNGNAIAALIKNAEGKNQRVCVRDYVFKDIVEADPTATKEYAQWILNKFSDMIKEKKKKNGGAFSQEEAIRFVQEDLPQASHHLEVFDKNKRKDKFKRLAKNSTTLSHIEDPSDLYQYEELGQVFDAVDPFLDKDSSQLEETLYRYQDAGEAAIEFRDRFFTVYIPYSTDACTPFNGIASWCNVSPGNGMFESYRNNKRPDGSKSKLYIIINNKFFEGESEEIYQLHVETDQLKDRSNNMGHNNEIYEPVIKKSKGIADYLFNELDYHARQCGEDLDENVYANYLVKFGFTDNVFDYVQEGATKIKYLEKPLPKLPDLRKFKDTLTDIYIGDTGLTDIGEHFGELTELRRVALHSNNIKKLPESIGNLKNLEFINLSMNSELSYIPDSIANLDQSNGGSLLWFMIERDHPMKDKLDELLPNAIIEDDPPVEEDEEDG